MSAAWVAEQMRSHAILAPHLLPVEVTHTLGGVVVGRATREPDAGAAVRFSTTWPVAFADFTPFAARVWELRDTLSSYDGWYVAVAEAAQVPVVTLDARSARAPGPRSAVEVAPGVRRQSGTLTSISSPRVAPSSSSRSSPDQNLPGS